MFPLKNNYLMKIGRKSLRNELALTGLDSVRPTLFLVPQRSLVRTKRGQH